MIKKHIPRAEVNHCWFKLVVSLLQRDEKNFNLLLHTIAYDQASKDKKTMIKHTIPLLKSQTNGPIKKHSENSILNQISRLELQTYILRAIK
jgi:hypothetical protein